MVVRDGVDPSTSGFSDRQFQQSDLGRSVGESARSPSRSVSGWWRRSGGIREWVAIVLRVPGLNYGLPHGA